MSSEKVKRPSSRPEPSVVALLRLLQPLEVLVELVPGREERAVDALQLRAVLVAAPVGAGDAGQLERPDLAGRPNVPAAAEVGEVGVGAEAERVGVGAELVDQLELERLVGEALARVGDLNLAPDEAVIALHLASHARSISLRSSGVSARGRSKS